MSRRKILNTSNPEADATRVPLLSDKNRKRRLQFAQAHQNWTIEDCKNVAWSDESRFLLRYSDDTVRIWRKEHEHRSILPCLNGSGWWWWFNGVGDIFLAHFGPLYSNWASFKRHSLPEYYCCPCPSLYDYSVLIFLCYYIYIYIPGKLFYSFESCELHNYVIYRYTMH